MTDIKPRRPDTEGQPGPVKAGDVRRFLSTLQGQDGEGYWPRNYTEQYVTVLEELEEDNDTDEPLWLVTVHGVTFAAWESELTLGGTNVYVLPTGEYVANPEWQEETK